MHERSLNWLLSAVAPSFSAEPALAAPAPDKTGTGLYRLTDIISPPASHGFIRPLDKASGLPSW
jgi:hypothetical protein